MEKVDDNFKSDDERLRNRCLLFKVGITTGDLLATRDVAHTIFRPHGRAIRNLHNSGSSGSSCTAVGAAAVTAAGPALQRGLHTCVGRPKLGLLQSWVVGAWPTD
jgi:hypothetical protein